MIKPLPHHKISDTPFVHFFDELVPIAPGTTDSEEKRSSGKNDLAAVYQQMFNLGISVYHRFCPENLCNILNMISQ